MKQHYGAVFARYLAREIDQAELRGFARSVADVEWLLLILVALYLIAPGPALAWPGFAAAVAVAFAVFILAFRFLPFLRRQTRLKIAVETVAMVVFTSAFLLAVPQGARDLLSLYLLPVIVAALTIGRWFTLGIVGLSCVSWLVAVIVPDPAQAQSIAFVTELGVHLAPFLLVAFITAMLAHDIELAKSRIRTLSETDELTGLSNMRAFSRMHRREHDRAVRNRRGYAVLVIDVDNLKQINDSMGHETGNRAIVLVANVIARLIRSTDAAARFGGDEFVVLLSESDATQARIVSRRIRSSIARASIEAAGRVAKTSVSIGVAAFPDDAEDPRELIVKADHEMYRSKEEAKIAGAAPRAAVASGERR